MALLDEPATTPTALVGEAPPSPAGPISEEELAGLAAPPEVPLPGALQVLRFSQRQIEFVFGGRRRLGDVFRFHGPVPGRPVLTAHPDHVRSIFTAKVEHVPTLTSESPLRPVVGPNSVLTANGPRHLRQRKLLLPPFHGEAIAQYREMITEAAEREIARWPVGRPLALAPRMQAITLDVIMAGIFGIEGKPSPGTPEFGLRQATRQLVQASTWPVYGLVELMNLGNDEPIGFTKAGLRILDGFTFSVIKRRRAAADLEERRDILSLLLQARTEEGEPLTDQELRDELLTLVLAGHETTANQLAWTWERLTRTPAAHERLLDAVREGDDAAASAEVDAVLHESMRSRPVIPVIGRRVQAPWQLGRYGVPAGTPISMSILLVHHREDVYPDPFSFRPERWHDAKPGTYSWLPFGGGTRRCLGAALAMAEMRVVLRAMAQRLDLEAVDPEPERAVHRNVTMIPRHGARVVVRRRL
ncbi:cytochrome P450 [Conexibacter sp. SYSU D00693]|uniref:cytochrome P450 n=1 Tax=Conexibacter sp. SYSU D00693 TaxID=2812560 RepID=UPI00196AF852|nr:cytochrome P450 [Conexibacter sp. SYSU D00693]